MYSNGSPGGQSPGQLSAAVTLAEAFTVPRVFISYRRSDQEDLVTRLKLKLALEARGTSLWFDCTTTRSTLGGDATPRLLVESSGTEALNSSVIEPCNPDAPISFGKILRDLRERLDSRLPAHQPQLVQLYERFRQAAAYISVSRAYRRAAWQAVRLFYKRDRNSVTGTDRIADLVRSNVTFATMRAATVAAARSPSILMKLPPPHRESDPADFSC